VAEGLTGAGDRDGGIDDATELQLRWRCATVHTRATDAGPYRSQVSFAIWDPLAATTLWLFPYSPLSASRRSRGWRQYLHVVQHFVAATAAGLVVPTLPTLTV